VVAGIANRPPWRPSIPSTPRRNLYELSGIDIVFLGLDKREFLSKNPGTSNWAFYRYAMEKIAGCFDPGHQYYITLDKTLTTRQFNVIKEIFLSRFTSKDLL
jgi:hypothetical protein